MPATESFSGAARAAGVARAAAGHGDPALKAVVAGLLASLPGMASIVLLIGLLYYVFAMIATKLYGADIPELFGTLGKSLVHAVHGDDAGRLGRASSSR